MSRPGIARKVVHVDVLLYVINRRRDDDVLTAVLRTTYAQVVAVGTNDVHSIIGLGENTLSVVSCPWAGFMVRVPAFGTLQSKKKLTGDQWWTRESCSGLRRLTSIFHVQRNFLARNYTLRTAPGVVVPNLYILVTPKSIQVPRRIELDASDGVDRDGGEQRCESGGGEHAVDRVWNASRRMYRWAMAS